MSLKSGLINKRNIFDLHIQLHSLFTFWKKIGTMAPSLRLIILALFLVMLDDSQGWKQPSKQTPPICSLRDWALTSWSRWIDCTFSCGKMARQWRQRRAFKLTNCFGFSPYLYRLDVLVQIRSCNQRCYNGGTLKDIWCSCKQGFSGRCCEKGEQYCYTFIGA